jgi:hypothetical protein
MSWYWGVTGVVGSAVSLAADTAKGMYWTCGADGTATHVSAYVSCDAGFLSNYSFAIYDDDGAGAGPGTLLGHTVTGTLAAGSGAGWRTLAMEAPVALTAGTLWIAILPQYANLNIWCTSTGATNDWMYMTGPDTWAAPWSVHNLEVNKRIYSMYVTMESGNVAPNAPVLASPIGGAVIDPAQQQTFSWAFSDADAGDTQSAYTLRYRVIGAANWTTLSEVVSPYSQHVFAGATFVTANDYEWQAKTKDALGLEGAYCASGLFTATTPPGVPTITAPAVDHSVTEATHAMTWTAAYQDAYQARTVADAAGSPNTAVVYQDTGTVEEPDTRAATLAFAVDGRTEHMQVRVRYSAAWSDWATVRVSTNFTDPMTPTLVLTCPQDDYGASLGYILLTPTQPTPAGDPLPPVVVGMDVYRSETNVKADAIRIAANIAPATAYKDCQVRSGIDYWYYIKSTSTTGTTADSALTT